MNYAMLIIFFLCTSILVFQTKKGSEQRVLTQDQKEIAQTLEPNKDSWFGAAHYGNWKSLESIQKSDQRSWDFTSSNGQTALMIASRYGQFEVIKKLIQLKASVNLTDTLGYHSLSYAPHGPTSEDVKSQLCDMLVTAGADPFMEDQLKLSPILLIIEKGFLSCIKKIKFSKLTLCDQQNRLSEVASLQDYADKEDESEIQDYLRLQGCR